ncbi:MAG TPA: translation initiation factor IF-2 N-terminal domain-containing protein, partial [Oceanipulchritudo sp.]|nr:translation initiation factor IF-2 N-terminal domain-containing protein [Oceanipulchritudo sp.]
MSVRIYQLSKEIGMDNADLIALLKERGFEVKSASSTVDNINAEALREEFGPKPEEAPAAEEQPAPVVAAEVKPVLPRGAIVRSKEDIERERREREEEEQRKRIEVFPPKPVVMPGKTPPPLPKAPVITRRTVSPMPSRPAETGHHGPPKIPVLRTDLPKEQPVVEPEAPAAKPEVPVHKGPPAIKPPILRGPKPIAPPRVTIPQPTGPVAPVSSDEAGEEGEVGEVPAA